MKKYIVINCKFNRIHYKNLIGKIFNSENVPPYARIKEVKKMRKFLIIDWAGNICFNEKEFQSFNDAESFLCEFLNNNYETDRQEYSIIGI